MQVNVTVGVIGSGKSSVVSKRVNEMAKLNKGTTAVIVADNGLAKAKEDLKEIIEAKEIDQVFYDSENLQRQQRRKLYRFIKEIDADVKVNIIFMSFPRAHLKTLNSLKPTDEQMPEETLEELYITQQVPRVGADCDTFELNGIPLLTNSDIDVDEIAQLLPYVSGLWKHEIDKVFTPHDCAPWHLESVNEHIDMTIENAKLVDPYFKEVAIFHDLGKGMAKKIDETGFATYSGHANLSACYYLNHLYYKHNGDIPIELLDKVELVHQHMSAHRPVGDKNIRNNRLTPRILKEMSQFSEIDSKSKITAR